MLLQGVGREPYLGEYLLKGSRFSVPQNGHDIHIIVSPFHQLKDKSIIKTILHIIIEFACAHDILMSIIFLAVS
jgi:hypothetical protein